MVFYIANGVNSRSVGTELDKNEKYYSQVPNKRVGPNKKVGWLLWANFINE